jgi:hypothetical protein
VMPGGPSWAIDARGIDRAALTARTPIDKAAANLLIRIDALQRRGAQAPLA